MLTLSVVTAGCSTPDSGEAAGTSAAGSSELGPSDPGSSDPVTPSTETAAPELPADPPVDQQDAAATSAVQFPLRVTSGRRHLVDSRGRPFLITGDAAWSLIAQLSLSDARAYLKSRKANGFNTIMVNLVEHEFATRAPANRAGQRPFTSTAFGTPNPAYFRHADAVLKAARDLGFLVLLFPAYAGSGGGSEGWYREMKAAGPTRLTRYGQWVGRRYAHLRNIIWVQGGDFTVPEQNLVDALAKGIRAGAPGALQTYHGARSEDVYARWAGKPWFSLGNIYTDEVVTPTAWWAHGRSSKPFFLIEAVYENERGITPRVLRRQAYDALLGGASGQVFGNSPMWHFSARDGGGSGWKAALGSPGTRSMRTLSALFKGLAWWQLVPDVGQKLLPSPKAADDPVAAVSRDRRLAVVYVPRGQGVSLKLSGLRSPSVYSWRDPTTGRTVAAKPSAPRSGRVTLRPPGRNAGGDSDWVLVVRTR